MQVHEEKEKKDVKEEVMEDVKIKISKNTNNIQSRRKQKEYTKRSDRLRLIEECLPVVYHSSPFLKRFADELKIYHKFGGIVFHYSYMFPRTLRVLSLSCSIIVMLFIQSITYNVAQPDDGTCASIDLQEACLLEQSDLAQNANKCYWNASNSTCHYLDPSNDIMRVVYIALISGSISAPISIFVDWLIMNILSANTEVSGLSVGINNANRFKHKDRDGMQLQDSQLVQIHPLSNHQELKPSHSIHGSVSNTLNQVTQRWTIFRSDNINEKLQQTFLDEIVYGSEEVAEFTRMIEELKEYRMKLTMENVKEFDDEWSLDADGNFADLAQRSLITKFFGQCKRNTINPTSQSRHANQSEGISARNVSSVISSDLITTRMRAGLEIVHLDHVLLHKLHVYQVNAGYLSPDERVVMKVATSGSYCEHAVKKRLLYLFQRDLLSGVNGQILETKHKRDQQSPRMVPIQHKIYVWLLISCMMCGMLFYIFLFAIQQNEVRQRAWLRSFVLWLFLEVFVICTTVVYVTHFLIPGLVGSDIEKIKEKLIKTIGDYQKSLVVNNDQKQNEDLEVFNAAKYIFVSHRVASHFPELQESKMILHYHTVWPRQSYIATKNISASYSRRYSFIVSSVSVLLVYVIQTFAVCPTVVQDAFIQVLSTGIMGYVSILFLKLYRIHPVVPCLAIVLVFAIIHLIIKESNQHKFLKLTKLNGAIAPQITANAATEKNANIHSKIESSVVVMESSSSGPLHKPVHKSRRQSMAQGLKVVDALSAIQSVEDEEKSNEKQIYGENSMCLYEEDEDGEDEHSVSDFSANFLLSNKNSSSSSSSSSSGGSEVFNGSGINSLSHDENSESYSLCDTDVPHSDLNMFDYGMIMNGFDSTRDDISNENYDNIDNSYNTKNEKNDTDESELDGDIEEFFKHILDS